MFGISLPELIFVFFIFLMLFGPDKLPQAARSLGKLMAIFKRNSDMLRREFYNAVYTPAEEVRRNLEKSKHELKAVRAALLPEEKLDCEEIQIKKNSALKDPPPSAETNSEEQSSTRAEPESVSADAKDSTESKA